MTISQNNLRLAALGGAGSLPVPTWQGFVRARRMLALTASRTRTRTRLAVELVPERALRLAGRTREPAWFAPSLSLHCTIVGVDISQYGDRRRDDEVQLYIRRSMYEILQEAFDASGVPWRMCHREDQGDGVLIVAPPQVSTAALINGLIPYLDARLRRHNKLASDAATIRLRMSVHEGLVHTDENGVAGQALVHLFRLLDAPAFRCAFAASPAPLALVVSDYLYKTVISQVHGLIDPAAYYPIEAALKETRARAWIHTPSHLALVRQPHGRRPSAIRRPVRPSRQDHRPGGIVHQRPSCRTPRPPASNGVSRPESSNSPS
jgi:hypothetical protein